MNSPELTDQFLTHLRQHVFADCTATYEVHTNTELKEEIEEFLASGDSFEQWLDFQFKIEEELFSRSAPWGYEGPTDEQLKKHNREKCAFLGGLRKRIAEFKPTLSRAR